MKSKTKTSKLNKRKNNSNDNNNSGNRFLKFLRTPDMDGNGNVLGRVRGLRGGFKHHDHDHQQQPVFAYVDVGEKQGIVFPGSLSGDDTDDAHVDSDGDNNKNPKNEKKTRGCNARKIFRILRAVMFETSLAKKIRKKKPKQKQCQSDGDLLRKPEKSLNGNCMQQEGSEDENGKTSSRNNSSLCSSSVITSSCSSSLSSNPRYRSDRTNSFRSNYALEGKQDKDCFLEGRGKGFNGPNIGCCFLLVSLFVLVFWGKVCAIICTSTWLFFVPRRWSSGYVSSLKNDDNYTKFDSERYKKKVILEGLLERNHSRGL